MKAVPAHGRSRLSFGASRKIAVPLRRCPAKAGTVEDRFRLPVKAGQPGTFRCGEAHIVVVAGFVQRSAVQRTPALEMVRAMTAKATRALLVSSEAAVKAAAHQMGRSSRAQALGGWDAGFGVPAAGEVRCQLWKQGWWFPLLEPRTVPPPFPGNGAGVVSVLMEESGFDRLPARQTKARKGRVFDRCSIRPPPLGAMGWNGTGPGF